MYNLSVKQDQPKQDERRGSDHSVGGETTIVDSSFINLEKQVLTKLEPEKSMNEIPIGDQSPSHIFINQNHPANPVTSISLSKKVWMTCLLSLPTLALTYCTTSYAPSEMAIQEEFNASRELTAAGISLAVLGFGLGPVFLRPLSETIGRKKTLILSSILFTCFNVGSAVSQNVQTLLVCRFLGFVLGGSSISNSSAQVADFTSLKERASIYTIFNLAVSSGPCLGPLLGTFITNRAGWRWNLGVNAIFTFVAILPYIFFVPETHAPTIVRRVKGQDSKRSFKEIASSFWSRFKIVSTRPILFAFTEPLVAAIGLYLSLLYVIIYSFFEAFPYVFMEIRGWSFESTGLIYLTLILGFILSSIWPLATYQASQFNKIVDQVPLGERYSPEVRLLLPRYAIFLVPISLLIFGFTAPYPHVHWIAPAIAMTIFTFAMGILFSCLINYLADSYGPHNAIAQASASTMRCTLAAAAPLFSRQMYIGMTVQGACGMFAGISALGCLLPFVFYSKGAELRKRSKFAI